MVHAPSVLASHPPFGGFVVRDGHVELIGEDLSVEVGDLERVVDLSSDQRGSLPNLRGE